MENTRQRWTVPLATLGESLLIATLISLPVAHVQMAPALMSKMVLFAPSSAPPPPPPPAGIRREPLKIVPRKFDPAKLTAPTRILALAKETVPDLPDAPEIAGLTGGVPGGVPGGIPGGVLGGILNSLPTAPPPPPVAAAPPRPAPLSRISVGGDVQAGLLIHQVEPVYPPLAKAARIAGTVRLKAIVGCDGKVKDLTLISGPPLLVAASEAAVLQWLYKPTLLNGVPAEVDTEIFVTFVLRR